MATEEAGEFERALKRLEAINEKLEQENVGLDESVALFREGKELQRKCEGLLKAAQTSIEAAAAGLPDGATPLDAASVAPRTEAPGARPTPNAPAGKLPF